MNLKELHENEKEVSALKLFKGELGVTMAIQLQAGGELKEHSTKTPALLLCVQGAVTYADEKGQQIHLKPGGYVMIEPLVKHWLEAEAEVQLLLMR